jgi:glycine/D-amino acid oxidase-like deaminating enzyme
MSADNPLSAEQVEEFAQKLYDDLDTAWADGDHISQAEQVKMEQQDVATIKTFIGRIAQAAALAERERLMTVVEAHILLHWSEGGDMKPSGIFAALRANPNLR